MRTIAWLAVFLTSGLLASAQEPTPAKPKKGAESPVQAPAAAGATTAPTTVTLCRIYHAMTMGSDVCCFYCLPCPGCAPPVGHLFPCSSKVGACDCMYPHCEAVEIKIGPKGPEKIYSGTFPPDVKAKLEDIPSVLYDPGISTNLKKNIIKLDRTPDDGMDNSVLVYMVAAKIKPKGHKAESMAFAREIVDSTGVDPHSEPATDVEPIEGYPRLYRFSWNGYEGVAFVDHP
jgi:hypothetical protein